MQPEIKDLSLMPLAQLKCAYYDYLMEIQSAQVKLNEIYAEIQKKSSKTIGEVV